LFRGELTRVLMGQRRNTPSVAVSRLSFRFQYDDRKSGPGAPVARQIANVLEIEGVSVEQATIQLFEVSLVDATVYEDDLSRFLLD
jgi:hypothetical protein